jgi:hypothetical protein
MDYSMVVPLVGATADAVAMALARTEHRVQAPSAATKGEDDEADDGPADAKDSPKR